MTDIGNQPGGAPAAPPNLAPVMPSWSDTARIRIESNKANSEYRELYLAGDAAKANEMRTLHAIMAGNGSDAELAALAETVGLERRPTLAAAEKARVAAAAMAPKNYRPLYGRFGQEVPTEQLALVDRELTGWASEMKFAPAVGRAITQRVVDVGTSLREKSPEALSAWLSAQDDALLRIAGGDQKLVDQWKDQATKFLQGKGSKFTPANSIALRDAWAVRTLAGLGAQ
jgi:hypothetical protein